MGFVVRWPSKMQGGIFFAKIVGRGKQQFLVKFRYVSGGLLHQVFDSPKVRKGVFRVGSHYAQVERRSVTFPEQTMLKGEAFGLKYIKIISL